MLTSQKNRKPLMGFDQESNMFTTKLKEDEFSSNIRTEWSRKRSERASIRNSGKLQRD